MARKVSNTDFVIFELNNTPFPNHFPWSRLDPVVSRVKQPIWSSITAQGSDLFLMIGDNIYGDSEDVAVLREKYGMLGAEPGFQTLRMQTPVLATWDDHDYGINDGGAEFVSKVESQKAFNDFFEVEGGGKSDSPKVYDSHVFSPTQENGLKLFCWILGFIVRR